MVTVWFQVIYYSAKSVLLFVMIVGVLLDSEDVLRKWECDLENNVLASMIPEIYRLSMQRLSVTMWE